MQKWQCRWSPTLGELEATHQEIWGTEDYVDLQKPTVFFGCYGLPDFMAIRQHKGRKALLWCGTDIIHLTNGYWIDDVGIIKVDPKPFCEYLNQYVENWVENEVEYKALKKLGIRSKICPSFLGDVKKFEVSFKQGNKLYTSVSGDDFERYGWYLIPKLAKENPNIEFHCYGNIEIPFSPEELNMPNLIIHGRVPKEQMNAEIKEMQGALRLIEMEGFSEIVAKSILMGQYPVSVIAYPGCIKVSEISRVVKISKPNLKGREWLLKNVNKYPWNVKAFSTTLGA